MQDLRVMPKPPLAFAFSIAATGHSVSSKDLDSHDLPIPQCTDVPFEVSAFVRQTGHGTGSVCIHLAHKAACRRAGAPFFDGAFGVLVGVGKKGSAAAAAEPLGLPESCSHGVLQKGTNVRGR